MGLPIVIGSKSVSSRPIVTQNSSSESDDHPTGTETTIRYALPVPNSARASPSPLVAYAVTHSGDNFTSKHWLYELQALVRLDFYALEPKENGSDQDHGKKESKSHCAVVAEFCIQIAPAAEPLSTQQYRETRYTVPLPIPWSDKLAYPDPRTVKSNSSSLIAHFSSDRRSLICVFGLPLEDPSSGSSNLVPSNTMTVLFPLRRIPPRPYAAPQQPPPLPSYLVGTSSASNQTTEDTNKTNKTMLPLAAAPKPILDDLRQEPIDNITCLCNISLQDEGKKSFVLVGDGNGNIRAITEHPLSVSKPVPLLQSTTLLDHDHTETNKEDHNELEIIHSVTEGCEDDCYKGNLALCHVDGKISLWNWQLWRGPSENSENGILKEIPVHLDGSGTLWDFSLGSLLWRVPQANERVERIRWVTPRHLACLYASSSHTNCVAVRVWSWVDENDDVEPVERATLALKKQELMETATSTFVLPDTENSGNLVARVQSQLDYDASTDCLLISSAFKVETPNHKGTTMIQIPFVTIWNWRLNVRGFTLHHTNTSGALGISTVISQLILARDTRGRPRLAHVLSNHHSPHCRILKDLYETGTLSPLSQHRHFRYYKPIVPQTPLLLTHQSVSYPHASKLTVTEDYQIEWKDAMIPTENDFYHHENFGESNAPILACIGKRGLSIAVAGQRYGLWVLEEPSTTDQGTTTRKRPRWHRFSNDLNERSFRVVAMAWWEGRTDAKEDFMAEDLLVSVVAVSQGGQDALTAHYLSCWSPSRLDLQHQLFRQVSKEPHIGHDSQWGIRLADDIFSVSISILEEPTEHGTASQGSPRKAMILLSNDSLAKDFMVFQAQLVRRSQSSAVTYSEKQPCAALIRCVGEYNLGYPSDLFLAGGSFAFDLLSTRKGTNQSDLLDYVATIGAIRRGSTGFDAIAVSASEVFAIESVPLPSCSHSHFVEVTTYWLSEVAAMLHTFVWTLQLSDGSLICWSVPFCATVEDHAALVQNVSSAKGLWTTEGDCQTLVESCNLLLGSLCKTGSTETWMQLSSTTSKQEFPLGPLPGSDSGVVLVSGQMCRKLHRQLGQDFEKDDFSADFLGYEIFGPCDFLLFPPAIVSALYMFLQNPDAVHVKQHLLWRLGSYPFLDSAIIVLRLLALRAVEIHASTSSSNRSVLKSVTMLVRDLVSPLKFATFFLELGRQLEPKCFDHLHPLPDPHMQELSDLINTILESGCLEISVASLPLLEDRLHSSALCTFILNHCLHKLTIPSGQIFPEEEARITPDVFRYGLKLSDPDGYDEELNTDQLSEAINDSMANDSIRSQRNECIQDDEETPYTESNGASYFCGLSKFFGPSRRPNIEKKATMDAASSTSDNGFDFDVNDDVELVKPLTNEGPASIVSPSPTAAGVVARHMLRPIFTKGLPDWPEVGRISELVLGSRASISGVKSCSDEHFFALLKQTKVSAFESWVPKGASASEEVDRFLIQNLTICPQALTIDAAKAAYELVFVLLAYEDVCEDMHEEVPGLLLLTLVVGHCVDCVQIFTEGNRGESFLIKRFRKALHRLAR